MAGEVPEYRSTHQSVLYADLAIVTTSRQPSVAERQKLQRLRPSHSFPDVCQLLWRTFVGLLRSLLAPPWRPGGERHRSTPATRQLLYEAPCAAGPPSQPHKTPQRTGLAKTGAYLGRAEVKTDMRAAKRMRIAQLSVIPRARARCQLYISRCQAHNIQIAVHSSNAGPQPKHRNQNQEIGNNKRV